MSKGYWVIYLNNGTIIDKREIVYYLDSNRDYYFYDKENEEILYSIPRENILYIEWRVKC